MSRKRVALKPEREEMTTRFPILKMIGQNSSLSVGLDSFRFRAALIGLDQFPFQRRFCFQAIVHITPRGQAL